FAWATVREKNPSPLTWHWDRMREPKSDEDREFFQTGAKWVIEGLNHQHPTELYGLRPHLAKNADGSWFVQHVNTQDNGFSEFAVDGVSRMPAHDGPRGIGEL